VVGPLPFARQGTTSCGGASLLRWHGLINAARAFRFQGIARFPAPLNFGSLPARVEAMACDQLRRVRVNRTKPRASLLGVFAPPKEGLFCCTVFPKYFCLPIDTGEPFDIVPQRYGALRQNYSD